jgi:hypothetical protein
MPGRRSGPVADESPAFLAACETIVERTGMAAALVRGTVRLALREGGLSDEAVSAAQLTVVARSLLASELAAGGVADAESVCAAVAERLLGVEDAAREDSPETVFARLGR